MYATAALFTALAILIGAVVFFWRKSSRAAAAQNDHDDGANPSSSTPASRPQRKDTVALIGPMGAGKTSLFYQLSAHTTVETVPSSKRASVRCTITAADGGSAEVTLVDLPGAPQLKRAAVAEAASAGAVVLLLDSTAPYDQSPSNPYRAAADLLYELFTSPVTVVHRPALLVACGKADARGAAGVERARSILETELERLKTSRPSIVAAGAEGAAQVLLGEAGRAFSFAEDAPCASVAWAEASVPLTSPAGAAATSAGSTPWAGDAAVRAFIVRAVGGH